MIYGCEYEIQLRAFDKGLNTYQIKSSIILNPQSDTPSSTANIIYALNSLYLAKKRHGRRGLYVRSIAISWSLIRNLIKNPGKSKELLMVLFFCYLNSDKGFRSYRTDSQYYKGYPIRSLSRYTKECSIED